MHRLEYSAPQRAAVLLVAGIFLITTSSALANPMGVTRELSRHLARQEAVKGIASFYDDPGPTASGEQYDPTLFTAAVQIELRNKFGGIGFGRKYQPVYAIAEYAGKRAVIKLNDVGPLKPGRTIDLSRAAMEHFGGIALGLLPDFKVTLLPPGRDYTPGPFRDELVEREVQQLFEQQARLFAPFDGVAVVTAQIEQSGENHLDRCCPVASQQPAFNDIIVTGSTCKIVDTSAVADLTDSPFDETLVFNSL